MKLKYPFISTCDSCNTEFNLLSTEWMEGNEYQTFQFGKCLHCKRYHFTRPDSSFDRCPYCGFDQYDFTQICGECSPVLPLTKLENQDVSGINSFLTHTPSGFTENILKFLRGDTQTVMDLHQLDTKYLGGFHVITRGEDLAVFVTTAHHFPTSTLEVIWTLKTGHYIIVDVNEECLVETVINYPDFLKGYRMLPRQFSNSTGLFSSQFPF